MTQECHKDDSNTSTNSALQYKEEQKKLEAIFVRLVKRNPGLIIDLLQDATPSCSVHEASSSIPDWCLCGLCREMLTDIEKVCCGKTEQHCISISSAMANLCLNEAVLQLMLNYRNELFGLHAFSNDSHNSELRHAAYRQYIMWQHGCLGTGNKRIIPSCCVWKIRAAFPDPKGSYSGFRPSRLS
uniref:P2X purinoreceptor 7 intracellular domain-containing protein n=1 Tax=Callorhinchus milii TaxID=7868 RepID=A0A4W3JL13_CALMI